VSTATLEFPGREADAAAVVEAEPLVVAPDRARRRQNTGDRVFLGLLTAAGWVAPLLLALFLAVLVVGAWPSIRAFGLSFLTSSTWEPNPVREKYGAFPFLVGTLVSSLLALCLAAPVGIAVATFINEILPSRLRGPSRFLIEILATVPSVVYGLWGVFVLAPTVMNVLKPGLTKTFFYLPFFGPPYDPRNMLCAVLILSIMVLPVIVAVSLDAIRSVPASYREAALGLGATRWEMVRVAVWPAARSGFVGACILALGRALGETMAVTMVIGNRPQVSVSLFQPAYTIAAALANEFSEATTDLYVSALIELAAVLFVISLVVNAVARWLVWRVGAAPRGTL